MSTTQGDFQYHVTGCSFIVTVFFFLRHQAILTRRLTKFIGLRFYLHEGDLLNHFNKFLCDVAMDANIFFSICLKTWRVASQSTK